ncbi:unnamed protein product [Colias eurytheme]|nr:unnamed protein product [Colias eurytheme]
MKFLKIDTSLPTRKDLQQFVTTLKKSIVFLTKNPNNTDCNVVVGTFVMTCVLRRALLDSGSKLSKFEYTTVEDIIRKGDNYVSHYVYSNRLYGYGDLEYRVSLLYKDANIFTNSMNHFNENRLSKWILGDFVMHPFMKSIDNATLGKDTYINIIESMHRYHINITESDICLSRIMETPEPLNMNQLQPCRPDDYCKTCLLSKPSIGYSLSHRLLNMVFRRFVRRCYLQSANEDEETLDTLCAFMYRESVYLARRGYFARDMFLEHVALCALLGYKEFHRLHWFKKVASWVDEKGCIQEDRNFDINRTRIYKSATNNSRTKKKYTKMLKRLLLSDCHTHPMTLLTIVLAHAIRYVAYLI